MSLQAECQPPVRCRKLLVTILNETRSAPIHPDTRILHYKGGWHPILRDGHTFTRNRPMREGWEMFTLYTEVFLRADRHAHARKADLVLRALPHWYDTSTKMVRPVIYRLAIWRDALLDFRVKTRLAVARAKQAFATTQSR